MQSKSAQEPVIGIIGGMGPEATVELMRRVIRRTPARDDSDHLRLLVDCNPKVPSRIAFLLEGGSVDPAPILIEMAKGLQRQGATVLAIACNTAHAFAEPIREAVDIPLVDILEVSFAKLGGLVSTGPVVFGVLGSPALRRVGLLERRTSGSRLVAVHPDAEHEAMALSLIRNVKAGETGDDVIRRYAALKQHLMARGAEHTLVCCTEFSILEELQSPQQRATLDTLDALVDALATLASSTLSSQSRAHHATTRQDV